MTQVRKKSRRVPASSMFYAIVLSMLIGLVLMSLISLNYFHTVELESYSSTVELIDDCKSAQALLFSKSKSMTTGEWIDCAEISDETRIKVIDWGIWQVGLVKSKKRKEEISGEFIFGNKWSNQNLAIQLKNGINGLSISGKTEITGNVHVPGGRVKPAFIEGQSFNGNRLVNGNTSETPRKFPRIDPAERSRLELLENAGFENDSIIDVYDANALIVNQFNNKTVVLYASDSLSLLDVDYQGNIIIKSEKAINISPFAKLKNVICIAPKIYISENFKGSVQCFATQNIMVSQSVRLSYPSALYLNSENEVKGGITIGKESEIEGVIVLNKVPSDRTQKTIKIATGVEVKGQVYCEASLEHRGTIHGQIITHEFALRTPSASYKNYLLNATVNVHSLPSWFGGLTLENETGGISKLVDL